MADTEHPAHNTRYTAAVFDSEDRILAAASQARELGYDIHDVYTPYPIHGMDRAVGLHRSKLTWIAFVAGALGLAFGLGLQVWTSAYDWPLNVGGKPFNSFPLFIPVTFELMVLFSGLIAIGVLIIKNHLWLFKRRQVFDHVTDDKFVLVLRQADASFDTRRAEALFDRCGAIEVIEADKFV